MAGPLNLSALTSAHLASRVQDNLHTRQSCQSLTAYINDLHAKLWLDRA
ncbi:hypothetical protein [Catellatospora methionotrophica]